MDKNQIENVVLTSFICKILLNDKNKIELVGEVTSLTNFPLRLDFDYQKGTKERDLFDKRYSKSNQSPLKLTCQVSSNQFNKNISFLTEKHLIKESTKTVPLGILFILYFKPIYIFFSLFQLMIAIKKNYLPVEMEVRVH